MPGTAWPVTRSPPDSSWNLVLAPVLMPPETNFDTSTAIRLRSPSRSLPDASRAPFPTRSRQRSSANAAVGGLTPLPEERRRRATTFIFHAAAQSTEVSYLHHNLSLLHAWHTHDLRLHRVRLQAQGPEPLGDGGQAGEGVPGRDRRAGSGERAGRGQGHCVHSGLARQKKASPNTVAAYRDTCRLLLSFARERTGKAPSKLSLADLDATMIGAFLQHLEDHRVNGTPTRDARLAAIPSLFGYAAPRAPDHAAVISRVLAIPPRRRERAIVGYVTPEETDALLASWGSAVLFGVDLGLASGDYAGAPTVYVVVGHHRPQHHDGQYERKYGRAGQPPDHRHDDQDSRAADPDRHAMGKPQLRWSGSDRCRADGCFGEDVYDLAADVDERRGCAAVGGILAEQQVGSRAGEHQPEGDRQVGEKPQPKRAPRCDVRVGERRDGFDVDAIEVDPPHRDRGRHCERDQQAGRPVRRSRGRARDGADETLAQH